MWHNGRFEEEDAYDSLSGKERAQLEKMGVVQKRSEEEKNRSTFLNNAEVRKEIQFIQKSTWSCAYAVARTYLFATGVLERQQMYLRAVSRSSTHISDQQLAEIEKRKEEVKQIVRSGSVRDSRCIFESQDSPPPG